MKLSEKLAALEKETEAERPPAPPPAPGTRRPRADDKPKRASNWDVQKKKVRDLVVADVAPKVANLQGAALAEEVRAAVDRAIESEDIQVSPVERRKMVQELVQDTLGYGPLDPLLADGTITEVMCNAYDEIWIERNGQIEPVDVSFSDEAAYRQVIEKIVSAVGRRIDESSPMVDARLPDGSRVNAIVPPLAFRGPALTIRKFSADPYTVQDLIGFGTLTLPIAEVMEACVRGKLNIIVSGGSGSGKTTLLNVLSNFIPNNERVVTIEDSAELKLNQPNMGRLEARTPNYEGKGSVTIRDLVRNALRMRPDRIIVGESRGPEAIDMLQAMNTGHDGSLTTIHANSPQDVLYRLETMVTMSGFDLPLVAIRRQIASAVNVVIHVSRLADGNRRVIKVSEVLGMHQSEIILQDLFEYHKDMVNPDGTIQGKLETVGSFPTFIEKVMPAEKATLHRIFNASGKKGEAA